MTVPTETDDQIEHAEKRLKKIEWDLKQKEKEKSQHVVVTGMDIPIGDLVVILCKLVIASVPAVIICGIIWILLSVFIFGGLFGGFLK